MLLKFMICLLAGFGTGLAGLSAAAVISPMLITFLNINAYEAVGITLASDILASQPMQQGKRSEHSACYQ